MDEQRILIRGGIAVGGAADPEVQDVLVEGERIADVGADLDAPGARVVDAQGCYVLPGGVDGHVHMENPALGKTRSADDFYTGTVAAAAGGTTTIVDFVKQEPGGSLVDAFQRRRERAEANTVIDVAFHIVVPPTALSDGSFDDLHRLVDDGATSWKLFMAYPGLLMLDDATLRAAVRSAAELGVLVVVHAEDGHLVQAATDRLLRDGRTQAADHLYAHEERAEVRAVRRIIELAEEHGATVLIFHVSSAAAAAEIAEARARGVTVFAETCPQYLLLEFEQYAELGDAAAAYICSPPIRPRENREALWRHLEAGVFTTIGTDHCPFTLGQPDDLPPQKQLGRGYFPLIPNGVPGIQERLTVMWDAAVAKGGLNPSELVDLVAAGPAKLLGLHPRKGAIVRGADADIVVWDPEATTTITSEHLQGRADYSLYEGRRAQGQPRVVLSRGDVIAENGRCDAERGRGRFLVRGAPALA